MAFPVLDLTPQQWAWRLIRNIEREHLVLRDLNNYYEGIQKLSYIHPELLKEMGGRLREVVINWPRLVVDAVEERLDVEGFRRESDPAADDRLWYWWQANCMDEKSQQAHTDALVMRRSFLAIGAPQGTDDFPCMTVESPLQTWADIDPRTGEVRAALRKFIDHEGYPDNTIRHVYATLYLPDVTYWYELTGDQVDPIDVDEHGLGVVPVVPLVNRPRLLEPLGVSELADVIPLSDAANKIATDMMVSAEYHAMPRRYALGFDKKDFVDQDGKPLSTWQQIAGRLWATTKTQQDGASVGQFPEAQLTNFHNTIDALARLVATMSGLPPYYFGDDKSQPASAQAIRSSENRLIKRAERKQRAFGGSYEQAMRIAELIMDGKANPKSSTLETIWRDPATPTKAEAADASLKLYQGGITPLRQVREDLGYTQVQIERMETLDKKEDPANLSNIDPAGEIKGTPGRILPVDLRPGTLPPSGPQPPALPPGSPPGAPRPA